MKRRRLSKEEIDLWNKVASKAEKLHPQREVPKPAAKPNKQKVFTRAVQSVVSKPTESRPAYSPNHLAERLNMDRKSFGRMKRGKLVPEGRLDLHGMTLDQAQPALTRFILSSQSSGKRLVLVITGKGKANPDDGFMTRSRGVLKRQVPYWLQMPPMSHVVQQVSPAHIRHGGDGAFYVYLRRLR